MEQKTNPSGEQAAALQMRHLENRAANKNHKPHNKKRK